MNEIVNNLRGLLSETVKRMPYKGLLFSGGLDTSILASLNPKVVCFTVSLGSEAGDIYYSKLLAKLFNMEQIHKVVDIDEAIEAIPDVIKILGSFDPGIPNDLAVYFGLKLASKSGINQIATGDGSDELFGGYSFMRDITDLAGYIRKIAEKMHFSSKDIAEFFGVQIIQPFIDKEIIDFALGIPTDLKIKGDNGGFIGKWILRKTFENALPKEVVWQNKRPLEYGSGMNSLRRILCDKISDKEFEKRPASMKFISKEHFYYYKIYRRVVGEIPKPRQGQKQCPGCGTGMNMDAFHCKICGYVLLRIKPRR